MSAQPAPVSPQEDILEAVQYLDSISGSSDLTERKVARLGQIFSVTSDDSRPEILSVLLRIASNIGEIYNVREAALGAFVRGVKHDTVLPDHARALKAMVMNRYQTTEARQFILATALPAVFGVNNDAVSADGLKFMGIDYANNKPHWELTDAMRSAAASINELVQTYQGHKLDSCPKKIPPAPFPGS